jgi:hypothetical protein
MRITSQMRELRFPAITTQYQNKEKEKQSQKKGGRGDVSLPGKVIVKKVAEKRCLHCSCSPNNPFCKSWLCNNSEKPNKYLAHRCVIGYVNVSACMCDAVWSARARWCVWHGVCGMCGACMQREAMWWYVILRHAWCMWHA